MADRIKLQALINRTARDGMTRRYRLARVDTSGPVDVPEGVAVEGADGWIMVWRGEITNKPDGNQAP